MARRGENIHKRKDGRWEGRYIKARTPDRRICWGYIYGTTYAEVKQRLIHKKSEYGGFQLIDAHLTFTELAEAWLWSVKCGLKESTYAHYQYTLYKYVLPILGTVPILRLEENILDQALQKIIAPPDGQHKELGFSSARECLSMVRRICKYAVHLRLIRPMELSVRLPQEKSHSMTPLSVVEQNRLRTYVLSNPTPRKLGLLLGIESGLRIGEVCGLKWDDFDLKTGTVQIKRAVSRIPCGDGHTKIVIQTPKTRTSRREIPLSKHMVQALKILQKSYPSDAWFLSGNTIKPVEPRCYRKSIFFHGLWSNGYVSGEPTYKITKNQGWNLLLVSMRAHDESEGEFSTLGVIEQYDCKAWANWAVERFGEEKSVFFMGVSTGASVAMMSSNLGLPKSVRGIIDDCGFTSTMEMIDVNCKSHLPDYIPTRMFDFFVEMGTSVWGHFCISKADACKAVSQTDIPILIIHGARDTKAPLSMAYRLYDSCSSEKQLYVVHGANHAESYRKDPEGYENVIAQFVEEHSEALKKEY